MNSGVYLQMYVLDLCFIIFLISEFSVFMLASPKHVEEN